jgi:hypothetical protein
MVGRMVDIEAARRFLDTAYERADSIAVFLKSCAGGPVRQRVVPVEWAASTPSLLWLRHMNCAGFNVYISVNSIRKGCRSRTRDAIAEIRHVFLDADRDGGCVMSAIERRTDLARPSYVLLSSPGRVHVFWRATGFEGSYAERLEKRLAAELNTDPAATPITQMTRLPGFLNRKYHRPHLVTVEYGDVSRRFGPHEFPQPLEIRPRAVTPRRRPARDSSAARERAKRYLAAVPAAIAGRHGDLHTFRVCCRLVRGFALSDKQALDVLCEWNARCQPPWSREELVDKVRRALRYGREPVGGLL